MATTPTTLEVNGRTWTTGEFTTDDVYTALNICGEMHAEAAGDYLAACRALRGRPGEAEARVASDEVALPGTPLFSARRARRAYDEATKRCNALEAAKDTLIRMALSTMFFSSAGVGL